MEHTKGKWVVNTVRGIRVQTNNKCICLVGENDEEDEVNARLIAAAPDMYEALNAWSELWAMRPLDSGCDIDAILEKCWDKTEKALDKAEGK